MWRAIATQVGLAGLSASHAVGNMPAMFDTADQRLAAFAAAHHSVFTTSDARNAGLSHGQTDRRASGFWIPLHDGVYRMPGSEPTWKSSLLAACFAASAPRAISHRSAAALYELLGGRDDLVELTCTRWLRSRRSGVVVHESTRIDPDDITERDGIPVMRPERVVLELAGLRSSPRFVEMVIQSARRKRLITYESTHTFLNRHARRGVPGVKTLRSALEVWDPTQRATDSEMETRLLQLLRSSGLTNAVPQFEIHDATGSLVARVDVALPGQKIAIEYDSKQEHSDEFQLAHDARRRNRIVANGWRHITARHRELVSGGAELLEAIHAVTRAQ